MARRRRLDLTTFPDFASALRVAMGEDSQTKAAKAMGVPQGRVSRWLAGTVQPDRYDPDVMARVGAYLGVPPLKLADRLKQWKPANRPLSPVEELREQNRLLREDLAKMETTVRYLEAFVEGLRAARGDGQPTSSPSAAAT